MLLRLYISVGIVNMVPLTMQLLHIQLTLFPNYFNNSLTQKALKEIFCDIWPCYTACILYG